MSTPTKIASLGPVHGFAPPFSLEFESPIQGLVMDGVDLMMTQDFTQQLSKFAFPLSGLVRVTDGFTCRDRSPRGDCSTYVPFTLNFAQMNPSCPDDILTFAREDQLRVRWSFPRIQDTNGVTIAVNSTITPNSYFPTGQTTTVSYHRSTGDDDSQDVGTLVQCSFEVAHLSMLRMLIDLEVSSWKNHYLNVPASFIYCT